MSNQLIKDFPNIFYFNDIDKQIKFLKEKTFESHYNFMLNSFNQMNNEVDKNKIIISDTISDLFIKFDEIVNYKKIYIHKKFLDKERDNFLRLNIFNGYTKYIDDWDSKYNPSEDFLYDRENYEELKTWLYKKVFLQ